MWEFAREILDGYANAYYFDPFKPIELFELMHKVISGEIVKQRIVENKPIENTWGEIINLLENIEW